MPSARAHASLAPMDACASPADGLNLDRAGRIKALREAHGMTGADLAAKVEVSRRTIVDWERGKAITRGHEIALADALGTTRDYLQHGDVDPDGSVPSGDLVSTVTRIESTLREHDHRMNQRLRDGGEATSRLAKDLRATDEVLRSATTVLEALVLELRALRQALATREPPAEDGRPRQGSLAILPHQAGPAAG
jgi:transcriptional regulator with XRE-family HTH domain